MSIGVIHYLVMDELGRMSRMKSNLRFPWEDPCRPGEERLPHAVTCAGSANKNSAASERSGARTGLT